MNALNIKSYLRTVIPDKLSVKIRDGHVIEFDFDEIDKSFNVLDEKCKAYYRPIFERARKKLESALVEDLHLLKFLKRKIDDDTVHEIEEHIEECNLNRIFHGKLSFKDLFILEFTYDRNSIDKTDKKT